VNADIESSLTFSIGLIKSVTSIFAFTIILWNLSGPMTIGGITIPHAMVFLVFIYVLISTGLAFRIGRPLIQLNFNNERLNADYRYSLIRVKEYAESIAFFRGENAEKNVLFRQFNRVIGNAWQIVYRTLKFEGFNLGVSQASVVFPFIIQAPRYFAEQIQLGDLIQTSNAFGKVQNSLSFFRNTYDTFAGYRAVLNRLTGFYTAVEHAAAQTDNVEIQEGDSVVFDGLTVRTPEGKVLVADLNMKLQAGDSLLIQGPSGAGKTTLLRSIAGLWGYCQGSITCPTESALFLSQKPYLPQGRLIDALCYPEIAQDDEDLAQAENVLNKVQLGHLSAKLSEENDWSRVLSLGEQQRLTFARLLMHKPKVAFLDESTASMDEGLEFAMYSLLKAELPQTMIISVGHRSTLQVHHSQYLHIKENGAWELN
jgi:putative ATP-binding cassette transporter